MRSQENEERFRTLIEEGFGRGNVGVVDDLVVTDCVEHQRGLKPGAAGVKETIRTLRSWFGDFDLKVEDLVSVDDMVWARNIASGTNTGSVMGMPPTNKRMRITVFDVARFEHGRMVEHWGVPDQLGMLLQLGLAVRPQQTAAGAADRP